MKWIIQSKLFSLLLFVVVCVAGLFSFTHLNVDAFPDVSPNLVQVFTQTEGLAPEEIEKYISLPIEREMNGLPSLKNIRSVSNYGLSVVNIYFEDEFDIYLARQLVAERLQEVGENIPESMGQPELGPISSGMGLVLFYYLKDTTGARSLTEMREIQDWVIKNRIQSVKGVTEVLGIGGFEREFQIELNPLTMVELDLDILEVKDAVENSSLNVGAQFLTINSEEIVVRSLGMLNKIKDIRNILIKDLNGTKIRLSDIAEVIDGKAPRRGLQTLNGVEEVVSGMVVKILGSNSSSVIESVDEEMKSLQRSLPQGVIIVPYYEQKTLVESCINTVWNSLGFGIVLVVFCILFLNGSFSSSLIVALSVPFSVSFAFIGMYLFGLSANIMSIGGVVIAIGMMVDDSIVMVENIGKWFKKNKEEANKTTKTDLILKAYQQIKRPLIFSTLIVLIVFLPIVTLSGVEGKTFRPMAYSIILAMLGSLIYATLISPIFSLLILKDSSKWDPLSKLKSTYQYGLTLALKYSVIVLMASLLFLGFGVHQFQKLGSEFTPKLQEGTIVVRLSMAPSISIEASKQTTFIVESRLMKVKEIREVVSRIGRGEVGAHADPINSAEIYVNLHSKDEWRVQTQQELQTIIRRELGDIPGVKFNFTQPIAMAVDELLEGVKGELALKLVGADLDLLKIHGDEIKEVIESIEGAQDVQVDQITGVPQIQFQVDHDAILRYGIRLADLQKSLSYFVGGVELGRVFEGDRYFSLTMRAQADNRMSLEEIKLLTVRSLSGVLIPLSELVQVSQFVGPRQITRENGQRFITIQANVEGVDIGHFVSQAKTKIAEKINLPDAYYIKWGGQYKLKEEADKRFAVVIPITLVMVLMLLFVSFNRWSATLLIFVNIPFALIGGVFALTIAGIPLSVPSTIGFIALLGVALGNGMVLVDHILKTPSLKDACQDRLKPVLMTAMTTALGVLPMLLNNGTGAEVQRPLAIVLAGGIMSSTLVTLLVLPVIYQKFFHKEKPT